VTEFIPPSWSCPASGPTDANLMYVGESPGVEEMKQNRAFVGASGQILWQASARHAGVLRSRVRVTNWYPHAGFGRDAKELFKKNPELMGRYDMELWHEVQRTDPATVVLLGGYAVRSMIGQDYNLFWANGIPIKRDGRVFIPVVHPAAGLHESTMLERTIQGMKGVGAYLRGELEPRKWKDWKSGGTHIAVKGGPVYWEGDTLAIDTEGLIESPFCLSFSGCGEISHIIYVS